MGLDNGIIVKTKINYPKFVDVTHINNTDEICYWRKCWGIRNSIMALFPERTKTQSIFNLTREDIWDILNILKWFNNKNKWDTSANSIWEYHEFKPILKRQIKTLKWLYSYMNNHEVELYFYDSY